MNDSATKQITIIILYVVLPSPIVFASLTLVGKDREAQGVVGGSNVDTFGILIRNHQGPFCIDIHSIKVGGLVGCVMCYLHAVHF